MKYILTITTFTTLTVWTGCSKTDSSQIPSNDEIQEAVFRSQLKDHYDSTNNLVYYVLAKISYDSISKSNAYTNPSDSIVLKIQQDYPKVKKYSESYFYDSNSTYDGLLYFLESWHDSTKSGIILNGGEYFTRNLITYYKYYLNKKAGIWIVDSTKKSGYNLL